MAILWNCDQRFSINLRINSPESLIPPLNSQRENADILYLYIKYMLIKLILQIEYVKCCWTYHNTTTAYDFL